jgi:hypothetical protein
VSRPALDTLAAQLSASLSEMSAALHRKLSESPESEINQTPDLGEAPGVDSPLVSAAPVTESPFRKPAIPVEKPMESGTPVSRNGVLDALIAAFRRFVGAAPPAPQTLSGRPVKRFRTARHRVRKH